MGYSEIQGKKIIWYAEVEIEGKRLQCFYHHSQDALPPGMGVGMYHETSFV